jgi:hypothetical protein
VGGGRSAYAEARTVCSATDLDDAGASERDLLSAARRHCGAADHEEPAAALDH